MTEVSSELRMLREVVRAVGAALRREEQRLCDLDAAVGDGDHGLTMVRCWALVEREADREDAVSVAEVLEGAGRAVVAGGGGAAGPLLGAALTAAGRAAGDAGAGAAVRAAAMLEAAASEVSRRGGGLVGDRTMLDALAPAATVARQLSAAGATLADVLTIAARVAEDAAQATAEMVGRIGRATRLGDRVLGHPDPGAVSVAIVLRAVAGTIRGRDAVVDEDSG